jgi:hypothetical protein
MLILVDKKIPRQALNKLSGYGQVVLFETKGITYDAISGHPDVFFCQTPDILIVAPNTPEKYIKILEKNNVNFTFGNNPVGAKYPQTACYNALITDKYLIHSTNKTDKKILDLNNLREFINVTQGYTRCNCINVNEVYFVSDRLIYKALQQLRLKVTYVNPANIILHGFDNGFFGGCCGVFDNVLFVCGDLNVSKQGDLRDLLLNNEIDLVELYNGQLYDVGGILFIK